MKLACILAAAALLALAQPANVWEIRSIRAHGETVWVDKFEDGPNTCYVAYGHVYSGTSVSISCVKR